MNNIGDNPNSENQDLNNNYKNDSQSVSIFSFVKDLNIIERLTPKLKPMTENRISRNNLLELTEIQLQPQQVVQIENQIEAQPVDQPVIQPVIQIEEQPVNYYRLSLKWYCIYLLYGFFGSIFINIITSSPIMKFDMIFNILLSPIIYYNSPRKMLTRITNAELLYYYTIPFICGLFFRFLDYIPILSSFSLSFDNISTSIQITLLCILIITSLIMIAYYIYISSEPLINSLLFCIFVLVTSITCYYYYSMGGNIHIHHYFVGLIVMLLSKNSKYKIVITIHALGYAVYTEGISKWGFAPIFWTNN